jgi:hypothetical protein
MTRDRTHLKDGDEAWIAKYRAPLKDAPVEQSRSTRVREALNTAYTLALSHISRILDRWPRAHLQRSTQSSQPTPVWQRQSATRDMNLAGSDVKQPASPVLSPSLTSEAVSAEHTGE